MIGPTIVTRRDRPGVGGSATGGAAGSGTPVGSPVSLTGARGRRRCAFPCCPGHPGVPGRAEPADGRGVEGHAPERLSGRQRAGHPRSCRTVDPGLLSTVPVQGRSVAGHVPHGFGSRCGRGGTAGGGGAHRVDAVRGWIDEVLAIAYDRKRIQRLVMFNTVARQAVGYEAEEASLQDRLVSPLLQAIRRGSADGSFPRRTPSPTPTRSSPWSGAWLDPMCASAVRWSGSGRIPHTSASVFPPSVRSGRLRRSHGGGTVSRMNP